MQIEIIRDAPKQSHRDVRVPVDETGNDDLALRVNYLTGTVVEIHQGSRVDRNDAAVFDSNAAVFDHAPRAVHRDDSTASDYKVHNALPSLCERQ